MFVAHFNWDEPTGTKLAQILATNQFTGAGDSESIFNNAASFAGASLGGVGLASEPRFAVSPFPGIGGAAKALKEGGVLLNRLLTIDVNIPLLEDFSYEVKTNFTDLGSATDDIPLLGSIVNLFQTLGKLNTAGTGIVGQGLQNYKLQRWESTEPFRVPIKAILETRTDPYMDVYLPAIALTSMGILSQTATGSLYAPGFNMGSVPPPPAGGAAGANPGRPTVPPNFMAGSKVFNTFEIKTSSSISLPTTLVSVSPCFLETCKPTWSKDQTESGYPLWCELEIVLQSAYSAADSMFVWEGDPTGGFLKDPSSALKIGAKAIGGLGKNMIKQGSNQFR